MIKKFILISILWSNVALSEKNQFSTFFNSLESLKSDFTQTVYSIDDIFISETSGKLTFQRPQKLRWHVNKPSEQILLLNSDELWIIDTELEQAILQKTKDLSKTPLYWLINRPNAVKNIPKYSYSSAGIDWYVTSENTQPVSFGFTGHSLSAVSLENELDQIIYIVFDNMEVNSEINLENFELNLGSDFDIIRRHPR